MAHDNRQIRDVMTANPRCVGENDAILEAARIMREADTGVVPVVDGRKIIGMITDRDIVVRGVAEGKNVGDARVNELMSKNVRTVRDDARVDEVLQLMSSSDIRRVPVVNASDELVGIVSIGDISMKTSKDDKVGQALESISEARPNN